MCALLSASVERAKRAPQSGVQASAAIKYNQIKHYLYQLHQFTQTKLEKKQRFYGEKILGMIVDVFFRILES